MKNQLKIQTFRGSTTFGQDKKTNQLSDFKTKEKLLENIDLQTKKLKFYSLICDSFVLTENEEKNIKNSTAFVRFGWKVGLSSDWNVSCVDFHILSADI